MNQFLYALIVGTLAWWGFTFLSSLFDAINSAKLPSNGYVWDISVAGLYKYATAPYAWGTGIATAVIYLLISAVISSRN